jgi:hypothetical protein
MADELDPGPRPRVARDVAERCLALIAVISHSYPARRAKLPAWLHEHGILAFLSPQETTFVNDPEPAEHDIVQFSWRTEALAALLWALGGLPSLQPLNQQADLGQNVMFLSAARDPETFVVSAALRPDAHLDDAEAHLYHQHWRVRDAELFHKPMPPELDPGIVYERRYALSWLVGWGDDWDNVPTDT